MGGEDVIEVKQGGRQHLKILASTVIALPPGLVFSLITHPENEKIFRHLDACTYHQVLQRDDASGKVVVESEHVASWRIFALSGKVKTRLRVQQDFRSLEAQFQLVPRRFSMLRLFGGTWRVQPRPPGDCTGTCKGTSGSESSDECCLLTLEQELQPAIFLPPPLGGLLKQLACRQLRGIFQDLHQEAARIKGGAPTLWRLPGQPPTLVQAEAEQAAKQESCASELEQTHEVPPASEALP